MSVFVAQPHQVNVESEEVDVTAQMRQGHPQIAEGDAYITQLIKKHCQRLGRLVRVFDVGCGTGYFASKLITRIPEIELIVNEDEPHIISKLQCRLGNTSAQIFDRPFIEWKEPVDIILSWGAHHHLPKNYLAHAKELLPKDGVLILGDEFCPDYCDATHTARICSAEQIYIANGYILTTAAEIEAYEKQRYIPPIAYDLEWRRQQALWIWYRYVVDYAMERNCLAVAIDELRSAHDDLITDFGDEHKMSPLIAEQEFKLCGFQQISKKSLGSVDAPQYQSFFVYELEIASLNYQISPRPC